MGLSALLLSLGYGEQNSTIVLRQAAAGSAAGGAAAEKNTGPHLSVTLPRVPQSVLLSPPVPHGTRVLVRRGLRMQRVISMLLSFTGISCRL